LKAQTAVPLPPPDEVSEPPKPAAPPGPRRKLRGRVVPIAALDDLSIQAMWHIFERYYVDVTAERFRADLASKHSVILMQDAQSGAIKGFSTVQLFDREVSGRRIRVLFSGDTVLEAGYWGQGTLRRGFVRVMFLEKLRHPFTPLYWFLLSKGYRTYLLLARNVVSFWPRYDAATPPAIAQLIGTLAQEKFGKAWLPEQGVVRFEQSLGRVKPGAVPLTADLQEDPHVRFFHEANPGHGDGDELCCLGKLDLATCLHSARKFVRGLWLPAR